VPGLADLVGHNVIVIGVGPKDKVLAVDVGSVTMMTLVRVGEVTCGAPEAEPSP